jgi:hypothetical protein
MGCALEELLLGNGLRIKMEGNRTTSMWHPTGLYFEKACIVERDLNEEGW